MSHEDFPPCAICGANSWTSVHQGRIRDGTFGSWREARVCRCAGCSVHRLAESACLDVTAYQGTEYRQRLQQSHDERSHFTAHDELARFTLEALWPRSLRGQVVADIGCGGGALLDHVHGLATTLLAIEPGRAWAPSLQERGYLWFDSTGSALEHWAGRVDIVLSTQVIEHVDDPRRFLADIAGMLTRDGVAVVSTPNRRDVLMELLPHDFPSFFYRVQHRWSFDAESLGRAAVLAGLEAVEVRHVHRYGLANTMHWLKEGRPRGREPIPPLDAAIDRHWQAWLEATGRADNLYLIARRAGGPDR